MHDVFRLDDLTNDAQHMALAHWLCIARQDASVPLSRVMAGRLALSCRDHGVLLDMSAGAVREARVVSAGPSVTQALGIDPVGMSLSALMPASYVADLIPAYAFCAGSFRPLSCLDEVTYADGTRMLVRRLVLPLERQQPGGAFAARYLLMIYDPTAGEERGKVGSGTCRTMIGTRSLGAAVFRDRSG
ncbi:MAG: hypothetical protein ACOVN0_00095 [Niveispirillum sp.]|uniref:hypothetical protein n=1 Tax=Niveispirillum sp. TaxID=1917217 RepID=UPI003BA4E9C0